jgi:hypothetical protein
MNRHYWIHKKRVIIPLPAALKEELIEKGVVFEEKGQYNIKIVGKMVLIDFLEVDKKGDQK